MKYIIALLLLAGCGSSDMVTIDTGVSSSIISYRLSSTLTVYEFTTTENVNCVALSRSRGAGISCDWENSK